MELEGKREEKALYVVKLRCAHILGTTRMPIAISPSHCALCSRWELLIRPNGKFGSKHIISVEFELQWCAANGAAGEASDERRNFARLATTVSPHNP